MQKNIFNGCNRSRIYNFRGRNWEKETNEYEIPPLLVTVRETLKQKLREATAEYHFYC